MATRPLEPRALELLAELLEYPTPNVASAAAGAARMLAPACPEAAARVNHFAAWAEQTPPAELEEVYAAAFELNPMYCLYVGHHLFGESYQRSRFLVELRARYRETGISEGTELPDHLSLLLRYLAHERGPEADELIREALVPALAVMARERAGTDAERDSHSARGREAYVELLEALRLVLDDGATSADTPPATAPRRLELPVLQP
ncbi:MAG: molecular chaperone TorD family protein [Gemmatimonadetes bacterium]|nr:molecular chaperone TorD family protein [Gemmatimonadota bacterium]